MSDVTEIFVEVGGKPYQVIKTGRAQAEQVVQVTRWISRHGVPAIKSLQEQGGSLEVENGIEFLGKLVEHLTADALIDLFIAMVGCSKEDAELYFDIALLIDVLVQVYEHQPSVRRLIERFFLVPASEEGSGELSTTSE